MSPHEAFERCLELAKKASQENEVPIAAVLVKDHRLIAEATNETEKQNSFLAHAEMICLKKASELLKTKYLVDCELFVNVEPCRMCLTAAQLCRVSKVHFLLSSAKFGAEGKAYFATQSLLYENESLKDKSQKLMNDFFKKRR